MQSDKYTIAWFKIADCVSRGERERALGVYRLLSHSFNDNALAQQLEADIYLSFNDYDSAVRYYYQAAQSYKKSKRLFEAAAIYEHIAVLQESDELYYLLIEVYKILKIIPKVKYYSSILITRCINKKEWDTIQRLFDILSDDIFVSVKSTLYCTVLVTLKETEGLSNYTYEYIEKGINDLSFYDDQTIVQNFLYSIQSIDDDLYEYAVDYLKQK